MKTKEELFAEKHRSDDRTLVLEQIPGKGTVNSQGLVDSRLFKGGNTLHAIKTNNNMWALKYAAGGLPEPLKQTFTNFDTLFNFTSNYFEKRGLKIVRVDD